MKKVYAVLEVVGQGRTEPLEARGTQSDFGPLTIKFIIENFNSRAQAADRARELVRENPTKTYHIVESVQVFYSDAPVKELTF